MAKKKKVRRQRKFTFSAAVVAGLGTWLWKGYKDGGSGARGWNEVIRNEFMYISGYDIWHGKFEIQNMKFGALPVAVGVFAHKAASMLGINRMISRAGIPWVRI